MNFQTMSKQRKFILIAALVGALSVFLPWITVSAGILGFSSSNSVNGFHGAGIFYFILMAVIAGVAAMMGDQTEVLDKTMRLVVLIGGAIAAICVLMIIKDAMGNSSTGGFAIVDASPSVGAYLAIAAAIGVVALPLVYKNPGESLQGDFENLKQRIQSVSNNNNNSRQEPGVPGAGSTTTVSNSRMSELERLVELRTSGKITEEEYAEMKAKIMG